MLNYAFFCKTFATTSSAVEQCFYQRLIVFVTMHMLLARGWHNILSCCRLCDKAGELESGTQRGVEQRTSRGRERDSRLANTNGNSKKKWNINRNVLCKCFMGKEMQCYASNIQWERLYVCETVKTPLRTFTSKYFDNWNCQAGNEQIVLIKC